MTPLTNYVIIIICGAQLKNDDILAFLSFFQNFDFLDCLGGTLRAEMVQNGKKFCSSHSLSQEPHVSYDFHLWYTSVKW